MGFGLERKNSPQMSNNGLHCLKRSYAPLTGSVQDKAQNPMFLDITKRILGAVCKYWLLRPMFNLTFLVSPCSCFPMSHPLSSDKRSLTSQNCGCGGRQADLEVKGTITSEFGNSPYCNSWVRKLPRFSWVLFTQIDKTPTCSTLPPHPRQSCPGEVRECSDNERLADHFDECRCTCLEAGLLREGRRHSGLRLRKRGREEEKEARNHTDTGWRISTDSRTGRSQPEREGSPDGKVWVVFLWVRDINTLLLLPVESSVKSMQLTHAFVASGCGLHPSWHRLKQRDPTGQTAFCVTPVKGGK